MISPSEREAMKLGKLCFSNASGSYFKPGDRVVVYMSDHKFRAQVVRMISDDVVEVTYTAESGVIRTDRYYTSAVHYA